MAFVVNPHDEAIVDLWLGDVFVGELHATDRGFKLMTPGRIAVNKLPADQGAYEGAGPLALESLEVVITSTEV